MAGAGEAGFGPVDAVGADAQGEGGVGGNEERDTALAADARKVAAGGEAVGRAEMAPDDAEP